MAKIGQNLSRRDFLKLGVTATGAATLAAGCSGTHSIDRIQATSAEEQVILTTCDLCPSGCGLQVRVVAGRAVKVEGNPLHPLNQGVCCLKGQTALEVLYSPERLQHPRIQLGARGSGDWKEISWDEALEIIGKKLVEVRNVDQTYRVAFLHGETRGQMRGLIERFMQAYGSPNVISNESLGPAAVRTAMLLTQGINGLPVYDLNNANYVMAFGGNLLESSRNVIGYLASLAFMRRGRPQRGKLVAVHPRLSLTGVKADEWIPVRPGTYAALALGMANVIINSQLYDADFVRDFTFGFEDFEDEAGDPHQGFKNLVLERYSLERTAEITGVAAETIARLAGEFATNRPAVAVLPTEPGELSSGNSLYTAMAVHALNALVGSIDAAGGVLVQRFPQMADWPAFTPDSTAVDGLQHPRLDGAGSAELPLAASVYQQVAEHILSGQPYPLEMLFLYNANPVYELPQGGQFAQALAQVPFVVSFASVLDESAAHADIILPASTGLEIWGDDYLEGTGYAGISLRRPVVEPVHDTRNPGDVLIELAQRIDGSVAAALPWKSYAGLVRYRLSGIDLDWEKLEANGSWSEMVYFNAQPGSPAWSQVIGRDRLNAPQDGRFDFFSRELFALYQAAESSLPAEAIDLGCLPHFDLPQEPAGAPGEFPLLLVTQPLITQGSAWQGIVPTLQEAYGLQSAAKWDSWVEINPKVAEALQIADGDLVWVESPNGRVQTHARLYPGLWPNAVYIPSGQGHRTHVRWGRNAPDNLQVGVNPNSLMQVGSEPLTGLAVFNPTRVRITKA